MSIFDMVESYCNEIVLIPYALLHMVNCQCYIADGVSLRSRKMFLNVQIVKNVI